MRSPHALSFAALSNARRALLNGDRHAARHWAEQAAQLAPREEDAWLLLAATATPRASVIYLQRALEINPHSQRARQGMHWAIQRLRDTRTYSAGATQPVRTSLPHQAEASLQKAGFPYRGTFLAGVAILILGAFSLFYLHPPLSGNPSWVLAWIATPMPSNSPTVTPSPTATETFTLSPTATFTFTPTSTFSETPTVTPSLTPTPGPTDPPSPTATAQPFRPNGVDQYEFWVEVDLSEQMVYAHQGDQDLASFLVSTGKTGTPTVTGTFEVYVKYKSADMWGSDYYLPAVPYVMYFYKGYGLHGTYWHNNFGVPTSHGCVNLRTQDAEWLFNWVKIGTIVYVHR
jgi:lipoprotein-anchoring transpeptidase ErfK/SrfK